MTTARRSPFSSLCAATLLSATAFAQAPARIHVPADADPATVVAHAATVLPSPRQLAWQSGGFHAFVHFGMNTFTDREWGTGEEAPEQFAPSDLDANQWARTFRDAGMKGVVLTCKHHDGFCLWPSVTTEHDVAASPFRGGNGDVVAEVARACREHGLKFGVYLSPWDRSQATFGTKAYEHVFLSQLRELCTGYGELFEVWLDGAHCPPDDPDVFDWLAVISMVRELQPGAVIAITGPDVRWVGNEAGHTRAEEWSPLPLAQPAPGPFRSDRQSWRALWQLRAKNQEADLGSRERLAGVRTLFWWPAETDVSIRPGWFWHEAEDDRVKSPATLLDYWYAAVGGNAVLLLNVPPDRRGRIADPDVKALREVGRVLNATFSENLAQRDDADRTRDAGREVRFASPVTVDVFELREDVARSGQRVEAFHVDALVDGTWQECARGTTIGFRRLVRTEPVTATAFRYRIDATRAEPTIATFGLFRRP